MDIFLVFDFFLKLFYVVVAFVIMRLALRAFDKYTGVDFKKSFKGVQDDPKAFALYIGCRLLAIAILISSII